jgi:hypothetical protein
LGTGKVGGEERRPEGGEGGRSGTREKIVTQPCEEVCDLAELVAERARQDAEKEGALAGRWRCCGGATFPIGT